MLQAALVAAVAVLLVQGSAPWANVSDAKVDQKTVAERADGLHEALVRNVEGKTDSSAMSNEARKQKIRDSGFLSTVWVDVLYIVKTPFKWLWRGVIHFPFNFSKTGKMWWDDRKEKKAAAAS